MRVQYQLLDSLMPKSISVWGSVDSQYQRAGFCAVAEELHFGRAAERVHLAQPHLSRLVRALEDDLGAPLFVRTTRRVRLTAAGEALLEPAAALLRCEDEARAAVSAAPTGSQRAGAVLLRRTVGARRRGPPRPRRPGTAPPDRPRVPPRALRHDRGRRGPGEHRADLALARFEQPPAGVANRVVTRDHCVLAVPTSHLSRVARDCVSSTCATSRSSRCRKSSARRSGACSSPVPGGGLRPARSCRPRRTRGRASRSSRPAWDCTSPPTPPSGR